MTMTGNFSQVIFKLSKGESASEVNLTPDAWRILAQVDGTRSLAEIARGVGIESVSASQIAETLFKAGILQVAEGSAPPPRPTIDGSFFDAINRELTVRMGPLAVVIIEDEIMAMGETRDEFPRERVAELVERVSSAVRDDVKRVSFQKVMLDAIRQF